MLRKGNTVHDISPRARGLRALETAPVTSIAQKPPARIVVRALAALAAFCFVLAGHDAAGRIQTLRSSERAAGEVVAELRSSGQGASDPAPLVRFRTTDGAVVTVTGQARSGLFRLKPGDAVPVLYDPRTPQQATVGSLLAFWSPVLAWGGFGLALALSALGVWALARRSATR